MKDNHNFYKIVDADNSHVIYIVEKSMPDALALLATLDLLDCEYLICKKISPSDAEKIDIKDDNLVKTLAEAEIGSKFSNLA